MDIYIFVDVFFPLSLPGAVVIVMVWIYNYMCNQCLSSPTFWGRIPLMSRCIRYNIMW